MQAEEADYPAYRVEVAKSGRSACNKPGTRTKNYQDKKCPIDEDTEYKVRRSPREQPLVLEAMLSISFLFSGVAEARRFRAESKDRQFLGT